VQLASPLKALFDYAAASEDEVGFTKGSTVYGLKEIDGWWEGLNLELRKSRSPNQVPACFC
jgi:hypothetical protein